MTEPENVRHMRRYIDAWNDHDVAAIVAFVDDDTEGYSSAELRGLAEDWFAAFPDLTHDVQELVADGDRVLGRTPSPAGASTTRTSR